MAVSGILSGVRRGNSRKIVGKPQESLPESRNALNSRISGVRQGEPVANFGSTLRWTLSLLCRVIVEIDDHNLLEFSSYSCHAYGIFNDDSMHYHSRTEKTMTARDVPRFYTFFSAR